LYRKTDTLIFHIAAVI